LGIGILYEDLVKDGIARGLFKRVHVTELPRESIGYLVYHRSRPLSSTGQVLEAMMRERCTIGHHEPVSSDRDIPAEVSPEAAVTEEDSL
jgi:hypothetical protein